MNMMFKILWFEDEPAWFRMEKLQIEEILKKHCLTSEIERRDGGNLNVSELTSNDYDLILMDYKLAQGTTGDTVVAAIRKNDVLTDILFYSSEEKNMLAALSNGMPLVDGVYLTKRDNVVFTEKAEKLISKIVKRSEDIVNLRGFVLDNASDFEVRIKEILNICWHKFNDEQRKRLLNTTIALLERKKSWITKQVETTKSQENIFTYANNADHLLSIADRLDVMQEILPILCLEYDFTKKKEWDNFKDYYVDRINVYRNRLGHLKLGDEKIQIKGKSIEINQDLHRLLRKNIVEVGKTIDEIEKHITLNM